MQTKNVVHIRLKLKPQQQTPHTESRLSSLNRQYIRTFMRIDKFNSLRSVKPYKQSIIIQQPPTSNQRKRLLTISPLVIHPMQECFNHQKNVTVKLKQQIKRKCYTLNSDLNKYHTQESPFDNLDGGNQYREEILKKMKMQKIIQDQRKRQILSKQLLYNDNARLSNQSKRKFSNFPKDKQGQISKIKQIRNIFMKNKQGNGLFDKQKVKQDNKFPVLRYIAQQLKHIKSQSYIIVEYPQNKTILKYRSNICLEIASLTKIMTFYIAYKIVLDHKVDIKKESIIASKDVNNIPGTSAQIIEGERYTIEELLYGLMLPSGNDAANQLANWGGSLLGSGTKTQKRRKYFVAEMNKQARILKMNRTTFMNPHGLPNSQAKSTSEDLAKLCCACMNIQLFRQIVSCKQFTVKRQSQTHQIQINWKNTNKLLNTDGFIGIKTGITVTAGPCLAAAYQFNDKIYISILLGAAKMADRFNETKLLLRWCMTKLYPSLPELQQKMINDLRVSRRKVHESSEQQLQFAYGCKDQVQFQKRCEIIDQLT